MQYHTPSIPAIECPPLVPDNTPHPNLPLLRRHHEAPPDDPKTWSAVGTVIFVCPSCEQVESKEVHKHAA